MYIWFSWVCQPALGSMNLHATILGLYAYNACVQGLIFEVHFDLLQIFLCVQLLHSADWTGGQLSIVMQKIYRFHFIFNFKFVSNFSMFLLDYHSLHFLWSCCQKFVLLVAVQDLYQEIGILFQREQVLK